MIVTTELEYIAKNYFEVSFIWLGEFMAIVVVKVVHYLLLVQVYKFPSVDMDAFARVTIHNLLYL